MKLLVKEYLSSLRERGELDSVLPDLLSEMGLHVFSRPAVGVRQNGVDLAAVGKDEDGIKKVFLLTVKSGNLTRNDWNGSIQAVRPSLDEILDSYVSRRIPSQYAELPIAICVCVGGDIDQNVDSDLTDYENRNTTSKIEFQRWDGDYLANMLMSGVLRDGLLREDAKVSFRKAVAMLDEPEASYDCFRQMVKILGENIGKRQKDTVSFARQLNLCVWILYVWSRDANNLEAPYRCSELAILWCWKKMFPYLGKKSRPAREMAAAVTNIIQLHLTIANDLVKIRYLPSADIRDGLSSAVQSSESVDVNLKLFELVGRLALTGIWYQFLTNRQGNRSEESAAIMESMLNEYTDGLIQILNNNGTLRNPTMDAHSIEVSLVCMFLAMRDRYDAIQDWCGQVLPACVFAIRTNSAYPTISTEYEDLADHPRPREDQDYFQRATAGSTLIPTLIVWQKIANSNEKFDELAEFIRSDLSHCTLQLWVPDSSTDELIYTGAGNSGLALLDLEVTETCDELMDLVFEECRHSNAEFSQLSAARYGYWPILLAACRHHRIPIPINFWREFDHGSET